MDRRKRMRKSSVVTQSQLKKERDAHEMPYIPEEIIFCILVLLPAEFLYKCGRLVCKTWARIIGDPDFIKKNLETSKAGLLLRELYPRSLCSYIELQRGGLTVRKLKYTGIGYVVCTHDGLSLLRSYDEHKMRLSVANFVTRRMVHLPFLADINNPLSCGFQIARIPHTGKIKVCVAGDDLQGRSCWFVFALGSMASWTKIGCSHLGKFKVPRFCRAASSVEGVTYWKLNAGRMVALDLSNETTRCISLPSPEVEFCGFFKMGKNLAFVQTGDIASRIYVLENWKWSNPHTINVGVGLWASTCLDDHTFLFKIMTKNGFLTYNLKTSEKRTFRIDINFGHLFCLDGFTESLVSW